MRVGDITFGKNRHSACSYGAYHPVWKMSLKYSSKCKCKLFRGKGNAVVLWEFVKGGFDLKRMVQDDIPEDIMSLLRSEQTVGVNGMMCVCWCGRRQAVADKRGMRRKSSTEGRCRERTPEREVGARPGRVKSCVKYSSFYSKMNQKSFICLNRRLEWEGTFHKKSFQQWHSVQYAAQILVIEWMILGGIYSPQVKWWQLELGWWQWKQKLLAWEILKSELSRTCDGLIGHGTWRQQAFEDDSGFWHVYLWNSNAGKYHVFPFVVGS